MARVIVVLLLLQSFSSDVFGEIQIGDILTFLNEIQNGYSFSNQFEQNPEDLTLCQKHSHIYLNERNNLTGWALRSKSFFK